MGMKAERHGAYELDPDISMEQYEKFLSRVTGDHLAAKSKAQRADILSRMVRVSLSILGRLKDTQAALRDAESRIRGLEAMLPQLDTIEPVGYVNTHLGGHPSPLKPFIFLPVVPEGPGPGNRYVAPYNERDSHTMMNRLPLEMVELRYDQQPPDIEDFGVKKP